MINLAEKIGMLEKRISELETRSYSKLEDIILNSTFRVLPFFGQADGTNLTHQFSDSFFINKSILIKTIKFIPYYSSDAIDISFSDGTTETIPDSFRVERVFDPSSGGGVFIAPHSVNILINGSPAILSVDPTNDPGCIPPDYVLDNIYYLKKDVQSIDVNIIQEVLSDFTAPGTTITPNIKVFIECYIF